MKHSILKKIVDLKKQKKEFVIVTNLKNSNSTVYKLDEDLDEANDWINANQKVVLATVIQTWGSSPRPTGSRMIINEKGDFSGSVSGGCVESAVVREAQELINDNKPFKKLEFKVSNESAWEIGLACGGEIAVYLEQFN